MIRFVKNNGFYTLMHFMYRRTHITLIYKFVFGRKLNKYHSSSTVFTRLVTFSCSQNSNYYFVQSVLRLQKKIH